MNQFNFLLPVLFTQAKPISALNPVPSHEVRPISCIENGNHGEPEQDALTSSNNAWDLFESPRPI
ncbi:hypothetical protein PGT21_002587 [Puccinia graminis f. sp. tritici]|uniref:Uncharacterized protein n=1 Tax=Puccinia graminis f. sp. tritici TaxID=56615 RepID=A0A5B0NF18_PUCGR|nr:hypothetical protein PGT21_002587 [Puccinia graminis f. sp. tritici]KAA1129899.1 hypothetical protein PGTUg99_006206 [Puccinia graminis f. sp. tritici]